jgi:hypothetical protein
VSKKSRAAEKIDGLMERASESLVKGRYFECERESSRALELAHSAREWDRMARILMPLEEARRQKRLEAADTGAVHVASDIDELQRVEKIEPGCWLLEPMLVAAHAREFRDRADEQGSPVLVITREPETQLGQWPIAALGPVVVRTKVAPPEKLAPEWFLAAAESLGEEAIESVEPDLEAETRINRLMDRLGALRDHDELHQAIAQACRDALHEAAAA